MDACSWYYSKSHPLLLETLAQAIAFFFFVIGLDESKDPFRLIHGLWHTFAGWSSYVFFGGCLDPAAESPEGTKQEQQHKKAAGKSE